MNATAIKLVINFWHDECPDNPLEDGIWKMYSFSRRHSNHVDPEDVGFEYDDDGALGPDKDLQAKLNDGRAFLLDYYEHGQCMWSLSGGGPQCRWDTSRFAGILLWEAENEGAHPSTAEERTEWAKSAVEMFTSWCNGEVYGYTVEAFRVCECCEQDVELSEEEANLDLPSCGGYYSNDFAGMLEDIKCNIGGDWADYEVEFKEQHGYGLADEAKRLWKGE